ncbi:bifunctional 3'-5' exonuclease/DNA polymerase [Geminocystis sp. CENA526]|uniref:bifunctional 3'-5' exonuclease/DNA polymerase n=1 Tax=Geminocystis sp. CENA526 TaxID=1355871 RepID=UPI003D6F5718
MRELTPEDKNFIQSLVNKKAKTNNNEAISASFKSLQKVKPKPNFKDVINPPENKEGITDIKSDINSDTLICEGFGYQWHKEDLDYVIELLRGLTLVIEDLRTFLPEKIIQLSIEALKPKKKSNLNKSDSKKDISDNIKVMDKPDTAKPMNSDNFDKSDSISDKTMDIKTVKSDNISDNLSDKNINSNNLDKSDKRADTDKVILPPPKIKKVKSGNNQKMSDSNDNEDFELNNDEDKVNSQSTVIDDSYSLIENDEDLEKAIELLKDEKVLAIDTETTGLDAHLHKLRLIQIASENNPTFIIDAFKCDVKLLQPLLINEAIKIFHNAKFDIQFLMSNGLEVNQKIFDTQIAHQLINSGKDNLKSSLKVIALEYLGVELNKEERLTDWGKEELTIEQLKYSSIDSKILLPLREILRNKLIYASLTRVAKIEFDCVLAVAMMEFNGMLLDVSQWQNILEDTQKRKDELETELKAILKEKLAEFKNSNNEQLTLLANDFDFTKEINLDSPKQILETLNKAGIKCDNTNSKTLKKLLPEYPEILKPFLEYKKVTKIISSFGDSLLKKINPITGRLHGSYWQMGSSAGRFTSSNPNLQQIPRNNEARSCFVASPSHKLVIADYSQIELRIASEYANDRTMIEAYNRGEDLHKLTASIVLNKPLDEVTKDDRQIAKSANFGLIYGASVNGFRGYAESNYGISLSENEAKKIMDNFFKSYSGLSQWHKKTKSRIYNGGINETKTLSGRIRYFDNASPQQILNTPIQGTGADILKLALGRLVSALKPFNGKARILATVHDEIILEAHEDIADQVASVLSEVMVNSGKEFLKRVPIEADSSIGNNWSDK